VIYLGKRVKNERLHVQTVNTTVERVEGVQLIKAAEGISYMLNSLIQKRKTFNLLAY